MPQYDVILPEGHVILRDRATGRTLRFSAESGPLKLGTVELGFTFAPETIASLEAAAEPEGPQTDASADAPAPVPPAAVPGGASEMSEAQAAFERMRRLPPGFGLETELPFLSPASPMHPAPVEGVAAQRLPPLRTLEAPLESLTEGEFEASFASLIRARDEAAREAEFLAEIEADPEDVKELEERKRALDERITRVAHRFDEWRRLQKKVDEESLVHDA